MRNGVIQVLLVWSFLDSVDPKFIRFELNYEYFYKLHTDIDFRNVGNFQIKSKISYTVVESKPEYQEILLKIYNFHIRRSEDADPAGREIDFSKWFSFQIQPNGQILRVYHPPDDDEVLATKKGLAAMLSSKLHHKDEFSSDVLHENNGEWQYQTEEVGNEGPHSAKYIVKDTTTETEFKKIRNSKIIDNSEGYFEKICKEEIEYTEVVR